jgi:hypothetical protein
MFHAFYEKYKTTDAGWIVGSVDRRVIVEWNSSRTLVDT